MKTDRKAKNQGMNWIRQEKRLAIYLRDGMACAYCQATVEDGAKLTLDHVKPYSCGGSNSERNLMTCCMTCNSSRGNRSIGDWAVAVAQYRNHGQTAEMVLSYVASQTRKSLSPFKSEAAELIARRRTA